MSDRLHIPAEDAPHELTFMQWPNNAEVYQERWFLDHVQNTILRIANQISEFEPVILLAPQSEHTRIKGQISSSVELWDIPTDDLWARDSGPIFARSNNGDLAVMQIQFNGWGNKQTHSADGLIAKRVAERLDLPLLPTGLIGEGGGVDHDADGLIIAHQSSWKNDNRNPNMPLEEITERLLKAYGGNRVIWAPGLWDLDITDYHIDSLARLTAPNQVLINLPEDPDYNDPFHQTALDTHDILKRAGLKIDVIPEPNKRRVNAYDFVASYANYYVCNGGVISAEFGDDRTDEIARDALAAHFPNREIIQMNVDALGEIGGGIHCATQQMPKT